MTADQLREQLGQRLHRLAHDRPDRLPAQYRWENLPEQFREAYRQSADRELVPLVRKAQAAVLAPFETLFSGAPDTPCRTTWRPEDGALARGQVATSLTECVEVPMDELQATFDEAEREAGQ